MSKEIKGLDNLLSGVSSNLLAVIVVFMNIDLEEFKKKHNKNLKKIGLTYSIHRLEETKILEIYKHNE